MILAELIDEYVSGDWGNEELSDDTPNAVSCIRAADFVPILSVDYTNIPTRYISDTSYENKQLKVGDIVIEKSGGSPTQSTGRVIIITEELLKEKQHIVCSNFCEAFRLKEGWNPFYVFSYLQFLYNEGIFFNFEGKTSGLKNLQMEQAFSSIDIPEQKSDISILTSIDEKIALNRKINTELEALAKEIYDYWFVQFDFPDKDGKPYKSSGGKMVWNETLKRDIPEGWSDTPLSKIAKIENGATPSTLEEDNYGGDISWITPKDLSDKMTKFFSRGERSITQKGYESCSTTKLPAGSILMSSRAPIGLVAMASDEVCTNQGFKNIVPEDMDDRFYLYYYIRTYMPFIVALGSGTTFKEVSKDSMLSFPVLKVNNDKVYRRWITAAEQIFGKQNMLEKEIDELQSLRGYLLPLLMNGQVTIKD